MTRAALKAAVQAARGEIKTVLELVFAELNPGQRKKLLKNPTLAALVKLYRVDTET